MNLNLSIYTITAVNVAAHSTEGGTNSTEHKAVWVSSEVGPAASHSERKLQSQMIDVFSNGPGSSSKNIILKFFIKN